MTSQTLSLFSALQRQALRKEPGNREHTRFRRWSAAPSRQTLGGRQSRSIFGAGATPGPMTGASLAAPQTGALPRLWTGGRRQTAEQRHRCPSAKTGTPQGSGTEPVNCLQNGRDGAAVGRKTGKWTWNQHRLTSERHWFHVNRHWSRANRHRSDADQCRFHADQCQSHATDASPARIGIDPRPTDIASASTDIDSTPINVTPAPTNVDPRATFGDKWRIYWCFSIKWMVPKLIHPLAFPKTDENNKIGHNMVGTIALRCPRRAGTAWRSLLYCRPPGMIPGKIKDHTLRKPFLDFIHGWRESAKSTDTLVKGIIPFFPPRPAKKCWHDFAWPCKMRID
jgi:hypothetical protein